MHIVLHEKKSVLMTTGIHSPMPSKILIFKACTISSNTTKDVQIVKK